MSTRRSTQRTAPKPPAPFSLGSPSAAPPATTTNSIPSRKRISTRSAPSSATPHSASWTTTLRIRRLLLWFPVRVGFYFPKAEQSYTIATDNNPKEKNRGWAIDIGARVPAMRLTGDGGRNIEIRAAHLQQLQPGSWNHIAVSYDGSRHQSGLSFYLNGRAVPTQGRGNQVVELPGDIAVDTPLVLGRSLAEGA